MFLILIEKGVILSDEKNGLFSDFISANSITMNIEKHVCLLKANQPRLIKLSKYFTWAILDQTCVLGVTSLLLFPLLAYFLGNELFGVFVLAMGFINMVGRSPSIGFETFILREAVKYSAEEQSWMVRTMMVLSSFIVLPIGFLFMLGSSLLADKYHIPLLAKILPILGIYLIFFNIIETVLVPYRVLRQFHKIVFVHFSRTLFLFTAIPLYLAGGFEFIAYAWLIGTTAAIAAVLFLQYRDLFARPFFSVAFARQALSVWWPFSLSALLTFSEGKIDRLVLGYWWPEEAVAGFYAAVSLALTFTLPIGLTSRFILSLLSAKKEKTFWDKKLYILYAWGAVLVCLTFCVIGIFMGKPLIRMLYPGLFEKASSLWSWVVTGIMIGSLKIILRPFITKFLSPNVIFILAAVSIAVKAAFVLLLIPRYGALGASMSIFITSIFTSSLWLFIYFRYLILEKGGG